MSFNAIRSALAKHYKQETTVAEAEAELAKLSPQELAEFIFDAFNRGWISLGNMGLDEDGNIV